VNRQPLQRVDLVKQREVNMGERMEEAHIHIKHSEKSSKMRIKKCPEHLTEACGWPSQVGIKYTIELVKEHMGRILSKDERANTSVPLKHLTKPQQGFCFFFIF
jgi:hypothetical protein